MSKKKIEKPKRYVTRRQRSYWEKQKRRQRIILFSGIFTVLAVVVLVITGLCTQWYLPEIKPLGKTAIEVNGTEFKMDYYIDSLKFQSGGQSEFMQFFLDIVLENIEQNELIRQAALALGFSVGDDAIKQYIEDNQLPDNQAVRDLVETQFLREKLWDEYFDPQVSAETEQLHVMAMFLESQVQAQDIIARLEAGEDFAQLAGELSLDTLTKEEEGDLGWRPEGVLDRLLNTGVLDESAFSQTVGTLGQPIYDEDKTKSVGYWLIQVIERQEDVAEARIKAMLLGSEEVAQDIIARLEAGEDFGELAVEFSLLNDAENNLGDLGWVVEGNLSPAAEEFIFGDSELNVTSQPIRDEEQATSGGYWLVKIVDGDVREVSDENRDLLVAGALAQWQSVVLDDPENVVVDYLDEELRDFAIRKAVG